MIYFEGTIFSLKIKCVQGSGRRTKEGNQVGVHIKDIGVLFTFKKYGFSLPFF